MKALTVKFFLRKDRPTPHHEYPLFTRITYDRKKTEFKTEYSFKEVEWNTETQQCVGKKKNEINESLTFIKNELHRIKRDFDYQDKPYDVNTIKDIFLGIKKLKTGIVEYFNEVIERKSKLSNIYKPATINKYNGTVNHLKSYLKETLQKEDLNITLLDTKHCNLFKEFLQATDFQDSKLSPNTVNKHLSRLRTVLIQARNEELIVKSPFDQITISFKPSERIALTEKELETLATHSLGGNQSLKRVRDIFMFSVYTGLRYSDAMKVEMKNIKTDDEGKLYLELIQEKTNEKARIPLLKQAIDIIELYKKDDNRIVHNKLLPKISNQKINAYLKVIADLCVIDKPLSHHVARHTCATTVILNNGGSYETVKGWLGQKDIKTSQIYGKVTLKNLSDFANKISD